MKSSGRWLVLIVVLAAVLRTWNLSTQCLDVDEFAESQVRDMSYSESAWRADSMPPLFPMLLKTCLAVWPDDMTGRWLSAAIGVATVWLVGVYWARWLGQVLALATAALLAISPLHIYYSQYIRSYGLLMFWTVLVVGALADATKRNRRTDWGLFVMAAVGGLYTHYYFAIFLAAASAAFAIQAYGWKWSRRWWIANLSAIALALPLIAFVKSDLSYQKSLRDSRPLDIPTLGYTYVSMLTGHTVGPSKRELQVLPRREALKRALLAAATVAAIFLSLGWAGWRYLRERSLLSVLLNLVIAPVLLVGLLGLFANVTFNPRFVVWSLPPLLAGLAAGIVAGHRLWYVRVGVVLLVVLSATAIYNRQFGPSHRNEEIQSVGSYLKDEQQAPVFVLANYMMPVVQHYLPANWEANELPLVDDLEKMSDLETLPELASQTLSDRLPTGGAFWLVYTREFHGDPDGTVLEYLNSELSLTVVHEFDGVILYQGIVPSDG